MLSSNHPCSPLSLSSSAASFNTFSYPSPMELALPRPVSSLSTHPSFALHNASRASLRKSKVNHFDDKRDKTSHCSIDVERAVHVEQIRRQKRTNPNENSQ
jgi:hypothetical protein